MPRGQNLQKKSLDAGETMLRLRVVQQHLSKPTPKKQNEQGVVMKLDQTSKSEFNSARK